MSVEPEMRKRRAFSPAAVIGLVLVGVFSFAAFLVLSAFAPELSTGSNGGAQALSQSAVGYAGAVRLLNEIGDHVRVGRLTNDLSRRESLVVLTPESPVTWSELSQAAGATTLVILPKWMTVPDASHPGWVSRIEAASPELVAHMLDDIAPGLQVARASGAGHPSLIDPEKQSMDAGAIDQLQTIASPALSPVVTDTAGHIVMGRVIRNRRETNVYILADPDFFNTQGISDIGNAYAAMNMLQLIRGEGEPIVFDVTLNGLGAARSALRLAFQPPFLGFTLGFAIACALLAWRAALRFGPNTPAARAITLGKTALAENSAALIRLARRQKRLGRNYAAMTGTLTAEKLGLGRTNAEALAPALDRVSAAHAGRAAYSELAAKAESAKTPHQMLDAARKLYAWKKEITRAAR